MELDRSAARTRPAIDLDHVISALERGPDRRRSATGCRDGNAFVATAGVWGAVLLANEGRSRTIPDEHLQHVLRHERDVAPTVLVDGLR